MPRYFSREEAEALLPRVRHVLEELRELHGQIAPIQVQVDELKQRMRGNGHAHRGELADLQEHAQALAAEVEQRVSRLGAWGVLVKDLATGLVDFPAQRSGREIYLCWRLGEPHVAWWHYPEDGFAGRRPLDD